MAVANINANASLIGACHAFTQLQQRARFSVRMQVRVMLKMPVVAAFLLFPLVASAQTPTCRTLSDAEELQIAPGADEKLVNGSTIECKVGDTTVQTRFRVIDKRGATYECEVRAQGAKRYCWYGG